MALASASVAAFLNGIRNVTDMLFNTSITYVDVSLDRNEWGEEDTTHADTVVEVPLLCLREPVEMKEWLSYYGQEEIADWKLTFNRAYLTENHIVISGLDTDPGDGSVSMMTYEDRIILNGIDYEVYKIRPEADWVGNMVLIVVYIRKARFTAVEE
jgi:hypothetical protein